MSLNERISKIIAKSSNIYALTYITFVLTIENSKWTHVRRGFLISEIFLLQCIYEKNVSGEIEVSQ